MARRCLWCGTQDDLTRDHVVSRLQLRLALGREEYQKFCATVRKLNIMTLCSTCNNDKSDRSCDLRDAETHIRLRQALREYGIDGVIEWSKPSDIFQKEKYIVN